MVGHTAQEKSVNKVQDNEYQRFNLDGRNLFQEKIHSSEQVIKPVLSKNQPMQIAKQSPTCKTSQSLHFTASEALCSNKRLERHSTTAANTYNHSESEDLSRNKNPLISLFLSHLEGNSTSLSLDNFFNSSDHLPSRVPSGDSSVKLKVSNPVGDATHGIERKSEASKLDFLNILDERKSLLAADNGIVKSVCMVQDNQTANTREIDTSFSKKCSQISVSVDGSQTSFYPDQLSGMLQKLGGKSPKQHDKASVSNKDYCNHAVHGSSDPVLNAMVGHDSLNSDIPMSGNKTFHALSEQRVCGQAKVMHATSDHDKDYLIPDRKRICLAHCGCSKNKFVPRNDQKTTFWRDVPKKVYADAGISSTDKIAQALETTTRIGDQLDDCSPEFDGTRQSSQSTRAQKIFNMSSGSSAPVVTEVSTEVNNLTSCTANIRTTNMIHDLLVDEGSGNEKCGSSDEAVGCGECEETIHIKSKVDVATPGFHHLADHSSADLIDELSLMRPLKTKRVRNMNKCCADQENVNKNLNFERTPKTANRNESMELNGPDMLIPLSDYAFSSEIPNNLRHLEIDHSRSQGEVSPQPISVKKRTHLSACGTSSVKRKRSALSCNKSNLERFSIQHKLQDIEKQTLDDDHSLSRVETSRKKTKQVLAAYLKQENSTRTGKPPKYMSLNCIAPLGEISDFSPKAVLKLDMQMQTNFTESKICMMEKFQTHNSITAGVLDPSTKQWVHMVCGLWTPGTRCPNVDTMSTFDVSGASPAKKNIVSLLFGEGIL
ncbi:hypothetical protein B296_00011550 [Ensete ventricosum]|uniref:Uncharacterized protein n=1 Tax=Ensete ventricosum TaxID=4639 RepID=A0A426ZIL8_ENSVE|nr:hypothetical protein B296_00011550 [Ensete ventricosum]